MKFKQKTFQHFFNRSKVILVSGIFKDIDWEKIYYSIIRLKNPIKSLPSFFLQIINPDDYLIDYHNYKGKYQYNQLSNKGSKSFSLKKFKYMFHEYAFEKKNNSKFKFSYIIIVIEKFSMICFSIPNDIDSQVFNDINIWPKAIYSKFPVTSIKIDQLFRDLHQSSKGAIAFNPFSFRALFFDLKEKIEFLQKVHD